MICSRAMIYGVRYHALHSPVVLVVQVNKPLVIFRSDHSLPCIVLVLGAGNTQFSPATKGVLNVDFEGYDVPGIITITT